MGKSQFYCISYRCKIELLDTLQHNEMTKFRNGNLHVEIGCSVTKNWKLLSSKMRKSTTLRMRSAGSYFCRNYQMTKGRP